jgi:flavin-dependent dehydrogenase
MAAAKLAQAGMRVTLLDEKLAWEKPCGGGLTYKAYNQYPFLLHNGVAKKTVTRTCLSSERVGSATLELTRPLLIYSRYELNNLLLERASDAGVQIEKTRVTAMERTGETWRLQTTAGTVDADFCVVATGARNALAGVGTEWSAGNKMVALGYFIPVEREQVDIHFFPGMAGYIWVFPRKGHLSAGICAKGPTSQELRKKLERYLAERDIPIRDATFYAHVIPSLEKPQWRSNRVAGPDGWLWVMQQGSLILSLVRDCTTPFARLISRRMRCSVGALRLPMRTARLCSRSSWMRWNWHRDWRTVSISASSCMATCRRG